MKKPEVGKTYTFVRKRGDTFDHTDFTRHEDGSAGFLVDGHYSIFECHPDAWQQALTELGRLGFVELSEARESGFVPTDWPPKSENSTFHACSGPATVTPVSNESTNG